MPTQHSGNNKDRKRQRVRVTHKGLEAQQFSTVKPSSLSHEGTLPSISSGTTNAQQIRNILSERHAEEEGAAASSSAAFDPIVNDAVLMVVEKSAYWPPESLQALQQRTGVTLPAAEDGFDLYDRRAEEAAAKREKTLAAKQKGELQHPRGKPRRNVVEKLEDSEDESQAE